VDNPEAEIKAAGGVVIRTATKGPKVLLVHRPDYNDWSFPKGKLDPGEKFKQAALREVEEEAGFECKLHKPSLPSIYYEDRKGRSKEVRYWLMTAIAGEFEPNEEVDMIAWVRSDKVVERLSYAQDRSFFLDVIKSGRIDEVLA
jgi:8-oxo-dGTP pyrophosphatase MutT (NUDIX family)